MNSPAREKALQIFFRSSRNQQLIFPRSARSLAGVTGWIADNGVRFPRSRRLARAERGREDAALARPEHTQSV